METIDTLIVTRDRLLHVGFASTEDVALLANLRSVDGQASDRTSGRQRQVPDIRRSGASARAAARRERAIATLHIASRVMIVGGVLAGLLSAI